jgi:hypothetical protein
VSGAMRREEERGPGGAWREGGGGGFGCRGVAA